MERLTLTGAELMFVLSLVDEAARRRAEQRLRLQGGSADGTVVWDGLSSLAARGLAYGVGTDLVLMPPVTTIQSGLAAPTAWVEIAALAGDVVNAAHLYVHDQGMFLLAPKAFGTFELQGIRAGVSPVEVLISFARRFLGTGQPALVTCRGESMGGTLSIGLGRLADGSWVVTGDTPGSQRPMGTLDDAVADFGSVLASLAPAMASA